MKVYYYEYEDLGVWKFRKISVKYRLRKMRRFFLKTTYNSKSTVSKKMLSFKFLRYFYLNEYY